MKRIALFQAVFGLKLLNAALRKHRPLLTGKERVALGTDFHFNLLIGGTCLKSVTTGTGNLCGMILGMNVLFHRSVSPLSMGPPTHIPEKNYITGIRYMQAFR